MVAVGYGAQTSIQKQIDSLGTNMIMIMPGASTQGGVNQGAGTFNRLTVADAEKLAAREHCCSRPCRRWCSRTAQVIGGRATGARASTACPPTIRPIRDWPFESGAFFTRGGRARAAQGGGARRNRGEALCSRTAMRSASRCRFATCRSPWSACSRPKGQNAGGMDIGRHHPRALHHRAGAPERPVAASAQIIASTSSPQDMPAAQEEIRGILRESHQLGDGDDDDFTIRNQDELADAAHRAPRR